MQEIKLRKRDKGTIMAECVRSGILGGLNKLQKWGNLPPTTEMNKDQIILTLSSYILCDIEEEVDLEG